MQSTSCTLGWGVEGEGLEVQPHKDLHSTCVQVVIVGLVFQCPFRSSSWER